MLVVEKISLDQFEDWLVQESWDMHSDSSAVAQSLVASVELRLAEHSAGHLPLGQMLQEFRSLLNGLYVFDCNLDLSAMFMRSGSSISITPVQSRILSSETQPLTVYA